MPDGAHGEPAPGVEGSPAGGVSRLVAVDVSLACEGLRCWRVCLSYQIVELARFHSDGDDGGNVVILQKPSIAKLIIPSQS